LEIGKDLVLNDFENFKTAKTKTNIVDSRVSLNINFLIDCATFLHLECQIVWRLIRHLVNRDLIILETVYLKRSQL